VGLNTPHHQRHLQLQASGLALGLKIIGGGLQAMVHMHRPHLPGPTLCTGEQQGGGVGPTTESDHKRKARAEFSQGLFESLSHVPSLTAHLPLICWLWCR
jgi:hypothetical protein